MSPFDEHLKKIDNLISIKDEDKKPYTDIFDCIRDWLIEGMRSVSPVFNKLFADTYLFGSYPNRVRLISPSEFDVLIILAFPFPLKLSCEEDSPGFIRLYMNDILEYLFDDDNYYDVYSEFYHLVDYDTGYLRRTNFRRWFHNIIERAIKRPLSNRYSISYEKRAVAHTIYVRDCWSQKNVSLDFVPAISFKKVRWMHIRGYPPFKRRYFNSFYAIPKRPPGRGKAIGLYTFMMVNPMAERDLLWDKQYLKIVYRLLKSLRDRYELDRLKSVFLINIFLWEVKRRRPNFWNRPVGLIFVHVLSKLCDCFEKRFLPYFWVRDMNLLDILKDEDITEYSKSLNSIFATLVTYPQQTQLTLYRAATHFDIPSDDDDDY